MHRVLGVIETVHPIGVCASTASSIFAVISGRGQARIGGLSAEWTVGDVLAAPSWNAIELGASEDAVLLEVSDAPVFHKLGFYREG